jgi:hypothetical protein
LNEKAAAPGLENRDKQPWGFVALTRRHPLSTKVDTNLPTNGDRSGGIVRLRTKATEFSFIWVCMRMYVCMYIGK